MVTCKVDSPAPKSHSLYEPLPDGSLRVLELDGLCLAEDVASGIRDYALECRFRTISMEDVIAGNVSYTALSYCWGYPAEFSWRLVNCNGHTLRITINLYDALRQLSLDRTLGSLWVDAICIDQSNPEEKAQQIAMMGDIYSNANLVIAWLGSEVETASPDQARFWHAIHEVSRGKASKMPEEFVWRGSGFLMNVRWLKRAWTLQEIALAQKIRVQYGHYCIEWDIFTSLFKNNPSVLVINDLRKRKRWGKLADLLRASGWRRCELPEDKIYSLLGMYVGSPDLDATLRLPKEHLFAVVGLKLLEELDYAYFLRTGASELARAGKLPSDSHSWVTEWHTWDSGGDLPEGDVRKTMPEVYYRRARGSVAYRVTASGRDLGYRLGSLMPLPVTRLADLAFSRLFRQAFLIKFELVVPAVMLGVCKTHGRNSFAYYDETEIQKCFQAFPECVTRRKLRELFGSKAAFDQTPAVPYGLSDADGLYSSRNAWTAFKKHSRYRGCECDELTTSSMRRPFYNARDFDSDQTVETWSYQDHMACFLFDFSVVAIVRAERDQDTDFLRCGVVGYFMADALTSRIRGALKGNVNAEIEAIVKKQPWGSWSWLPTHLQLR